MKHCEQCGESFKPKRPEQRFCDRLCSNRWVGAHKDIRGERNPRFGKSHTEETRAKIRAAALGRAVRPETRAKLAAAHRGKPKPAVWRRAISNGLRRNHRLNHQGLLNTNYKHGRYIGERAYRLLVECDHCTECGATGVVLDVHHIDGNHKHDEGTNLQVLCRSCHGKKHGRPIGIKETKPRARQKHLVLRK